jgi:hypothetical protein
MEFQMFPMGEYDYPLHYPFPLTLPRTHRVDRRFAPTTPKLRAIGIGGSTLAGSATEILEAGAYQVPDFDINERIQSKYEIPIAIEETRPQPATATASAVPGHVIGGLGESLLGVKWRFHEHHPNDTWVKNRFGTGPPAAFDHHSESQPAEASGDTPGEEDSPNRLLISAC